MNVFSVLLVALSALAGTTCELIQWPSRDSDCPNDEDVESSTYLPDANDFRRFYRCIGGYSLLMTCPDRFHWSVERNRCEYHTTASFSYRKESRTVIASGDPHPDCPLNEDPFHPTKLPYPGDCSKFYMCSFGYGFVMSCSYGLHWDVKSNRCESHFVAGCESGTPASATSPSTLTTPKPTRPTTSMVPLDPSLPRPAPECSDSTSTKKFRIPGECARYLQCFRGLAYKINCRTGREWSDAVGDCVDAAVAGCSGTTTVITTATTTPATTRAIVTTASTTRAIATTARPRSCEEGVVFLPHPSNCRKFIQCDNSKPVERDCPLGTYWSKTGSVCDWSKSDC